MVSLAATYGQDPWEASLQAVRSGQGYDTRPGLPMVKSGHADAQLLLDGSSGGVTVLGLEASDEDAQCALMRSVWELVRTGQLQQAQHLAYEHKA